MYTSSAALIVSILALLGVIGTTRALNCGTTFACTGRNTYVPCDIDGNGKFVPVEESSMDCRDVNRNEPLCNDRVESPTSLLPCEADTTPPCERAGNFPIRGKCYRYYSCISIGRGFKKIFVNCEEGQEFNIMENMCTPANPNNDGVCGTILPATPPPPFRCTSSGRFPDPSSCRRYFICTGPDSNAIRANCRPSLNYDTVTRTCKDFVLCGIRPVNQ